MVLGMVEARRSFEIRVHGLPQPQGSKTAFVRNGRAVLVEGREAEARKRFKSWREGVAREAVEQIRLLEGWEPLVGALALSVTFYLPRPASAPKRVLWPAKRPDVDKLCRAVLDSLTGIAFADDSQIVDLAAFKRFDAMPGAHIMLAEKAPA